MASTGSPRLVRWDVVAFRHFTDTQSFSTVEDAVAALVQALSSCTRRVGGMWVFRTTGNAAGWKAAYKLPFNEPISVLVRSHDGISKRYSFQNLLNLALLYGDDLLAPSFTYDPRACAALPFNVLNLFLGFAASPSPLVENGAAIIAPILDHIRMVWADNDEDTYAFIMSWLATVARGLRTGVACLIYNLHTDYCLKDIFQFFGTRVFGNTNSSVSSTVCVHPCLNAGPSRFATQLKGGVPGCVFVGFYELEDAYFARERDWFDNKRVLRDMGDLVTRDTVDLQLYVTKTRTFKSTTRVNNCANLLMTGLFREPVREHSWLRQFRGGHVHDPDGSASKAVEEATRAVGAADAMLQHLLTLPPLVV